MNADLEDLKRRLEARRTELAGLRRLNQSDALEVLKFLSSSACGRDELTKIAEASREALQLHQSMATEFEKLIASFERALLSSSEQLQ